MKSFSAARSLLGALVLFLLVAAPFARGVILYRTADPAANTTAPSGSLAGSGWQWEGTWGGFLGTPIAPHFFLSAKHLGQAGGSVFNFAGNNYTVVKEFADPASDLDLWLVTETFPVFAPLYTKSDEAGKLTLLIGRGTLRGSERNSPGGLAGWNWGPGDGVQRWGTNVVSDIFVLAPDDEFIRCDFDANGPAEEGMLSSGDSGGAAFIEGGGVWKLAGIHYSVDGPFYLDSSGNGSFIAALFDSRGFYASADGSPPYTLIAGPNPVPAALYPTRVSAKLGWIYGVTAPTDDLDVDGSANLLEYAFHTDPLKPDAAQRPVVAIEGPDLTLTYTKVTTATDIQYVVEQSTELATWTTATPTDQIVATQGNLQTIKAKVARNGAPRLFLRLRITRP